jgi:peptide/nickel transport system ATP-binding protein
VDDVSFFIRRGETFGLVGESGCGKTTVARSIMRLLEPKSGEILLNGKNLVGLNDKQLLPYRRNMSMIFQDPFGSLDPRQLAGNIVGEPLRNFKLCATKEEYQERVDHLFELVGLDPILAGRMPHEFSGGQRQRIGIARSLATEPSFIVCDEAISALDVSIQAQIINILEDLQEKMGLTYLFIAHDLSVVKHISDRVAVMYLGQIVETADWKSLYDNPLHPYTRVLLDAIPVPDPEVEARRKYSIVRGEVPSLINKPAGCGFSNRCSRCGPECSQARPALAEKESGHWVACCKV